MKKLFFTLVAAMMTATATYAQNTLVATLTHGENVTMYYGTYALRDAHNAAVSGDVINLSGGGFQPVHITKAVALRGTGIDETVPTSIVGEFIINIPTDDANRLSMEGIRCQKSVHIRGAFDNPYFMKCVFYNMYFDDNPAIKNAMLVNCKITGGSSIGSNGTCTVQFINSYIRGFSNYSESTSSASFVNCIIWSYYPGEMRNCQLMNSIVYYEGNNSNVLASTSLANNCVAINFGSLYNNSQSNPNCSYSTYAEVFKSFSGTYSDTETFELTDEAKTKYLGTDGTQIGLYGGLMPYTSIPFYPRITKMNVASKTTADGKLSVDIEVSAAQ